MKSRWIGCLAVLAFPVLASAQKPTGLVETDSLASPLGNLVRACTGRLFEDPEAPRFVTVDRTGNYLFGVGGYVGVQGWYDWNNMQSPGLDVYGIPTDGGDRVGYAGLDAGTSRLFFRVLGLTPVGRLDAYVEADFSRPGHVLGLRHAYVTLGDFTVGQTRSLFSDVQTPSVLDGSGPLSVTGRRLPLVAWRRTLPSGLTLGAAAEFSNAAQASLIDPETGERKIEPVPQRLPDFPLTLVYDNDRLHLFFSWNNRLMTYRDYTRFRNRYAYALKLSGNVLLAEARGVRYRLYAQGVYTLGMADCLASAQGRGLNVAVSPDYTFLAVLPAWGATLGYEMQFGRHTLGAVYSRIGMLGLEGLGDDLYRSGDFASLTYIVNIFRYARAGLEGVWGRRADAGGETGDNMRINLLLRYDF